MTLGTSDLEAAGTAYQALITYPFLCLRVQAWLYEEEGGGAEEGGGEAAGGEQEQA